MEPVKNSDFGGIENLSKVNNIDGGILIAEIDLFHFNTPATLSSEPLIQRAIGDIIVLKGSLTMNIDSNIIVCTPTENNLVHLRSNHTVYSMSISNDFRGVLVAFTKYFMLTSMGFVDFVQISQLGMEPITVCYTLSGGEKQILSDGFSRILRNFNRETHRFRHYIIQLAAIDLTLDIANIIADKTHLKNYSGGRNDRKKELRNHFTELLTTNVREQHGVRFYADKLCITSQYLSKISRDSFGVSANRVIAVALINEATKLLRRNELSVEQISAQLNFADQASFSKFFKRHTGKNPLKYRKG